MILLSTVWNILYTILDMYCELCFWALRTKTLFVISYRLYRKYYLWIVINWYYFQNQKQRFICASLFKMMHQLWDVFANLEWSHFLDYDVYWPSPKPVIIFYCDTLYCHCDTLYCSGKWSAVSSRDNSKYFIRIWYSSHYHLYLPGVGWLTRPPPQGVNLE